MGKASDGSSAVVRAIRFVGHTTGMVKSLHGFRKGQHTVPDAVSAATTAFLARLCSEELKDESEDFFQKARSACDYKRKDIALNLSAPQALLVAKDFTLEIAYSFDGDDPASYRLQWTLNGFKDRDFLRGQACEEIFGGRFQELVFCLTQGTTVESVIDAIEGLEDGALRVDYPSDCDHCMLSVDGVDAQVRFDGTEMAMVFQKSGSPRELLDGFLSVREAFSLTKSKVLSGLLG